MSILRSEERKLTGWASERYWQVVGDSSLHLYRCSCRDPKFHESIQEHYAGATFSGWFPLKAKLPIRIGQGALCFAASQN